MKNPLGGQELKSPPLNKVLIKNLMKKSSGRPGAEISSFE